jgi:predicted membrane channel-forming protein YqfA (hemolysin III family)
MLKRLNQFGKRHNGSLALLGVFLSVVLWLFQPFTVPDALRIPLYVATGWCIYEFLKAAFSRLRASSKPSFPKGKIFFGLFDADHRPATDAVGLFKRSEEVSALADLILLPRQSERIVAVTGVSGAGKSVLVALLEEYFQNSRIEVARRRFNNSDKSNLVTLKELRTFIAKHEGGVLAGQNPGYVVVILDQFEVCLDYIVDVFLNTKNGGSLRAFLQGASQHKDALVRELGALVSLKKRFPTLRIVVSLRSDRYYDLRILGEYGQIPYEAFEVLGITAGEGLDSLRTAFSEINVDYRSVDQVMSALKEDDGTILPVKAQIVGSILEREVFYRPRTLPRRIFGGSQTRLAQPRLSMTYGMVQARGGIAGIIGQYFREVIESSPNGNVAREVLFVLGIEGRVRRRYTISDLARMTFHTEEELEPTLDHLVQGGLATLSMEGYGFVHDYIARTYNYLSGKLLRPVVRDNLAYSHATLVEARQQESATPISEGATNYGMWRYGLSLLKLTMLMVFIYRLMNYEKFQAWRWPRDVADKLSTAAVGQPLAAYSVSPQWSIDWHYLPLFVAQCCWAFYGIDLVGNVFNRIDHERSMRLGSATLIAMLLVGMTATAFVPGLWLVWIAVNGILVGAKFTALGRRIRKALGQGNDYLSIGLYTFINCGFVLWIGLLMSPYVAWDLPNYGTATTWELIKSIPRLAPIGEFMSVYYIVIPLLTYFVYMYRSHTISRRSVQFIGLYKRIGASAQIRNMPTA